MAAILEADAAARCEYATAADPALNYCLWPYPAPAPAEDRLRSVNLLYRSFAAAGLDDRAFALVDAIRAGIGPFRTVFGIKWVDGRLGWEFYFYDYRRRQRAVSVGTVLDAIQAIAPCAFRPAETLPYFMASLDIDAALLAGTRSIETVHLYVGNPGSAVSSGIAYAVGAETTRLENFYFFFDAATQLAEVAGKIASSAVYDDTRVAMPAVLRPEFARCRTICVANKATHDCVYFSGLEVAQLRRFLAWQDYPAALQDFVAEQQEGLAHLLFDAGFDYRMQDGGLRVLKSGFYGVF